MQIPILNGVYTDLDADFRIAYPINMRPVPQDTGLSTGYLRPVDGVVELGEGPGVSRGAINWNGKHYRVMGEQLCEILENGVVIQLGSVEDDGKQVTFAYSFDRLAIASNEKLFYLTSGTLQEVTDPDLGRVLDVVWVDGFFMTTDGTFLVVTDLSDPTSVNPLKYGSSEVDPDPILGLVKLRNEVYAVNRYTIEVFDNVGGSGFPFARIDSAQIPKGTLGTHCATMYQQSIAFIGSGEKEPPRIYLGVNGQTQKISTPEIDSVLALYSEEELALSVLEAVGKKTNELWVRLPDRTLVYDMRSSQELGRPVWFIMSSGPRDVLTQYRAKDVIWCYDKWQVADTQSEKFGTLDETISTQFGTSAAWEITTSIIYNNSKGALFHSLELVGLPGRSAFGDTAQIWTSYSTDGVVWSMERPISPGVNGERKKRMIWRKQGPMRNYRIQRFRGDSEAFLSVARLEAELEALNA